MADPATRIAAASRVLIAARRERRVLDQPDPAWAPRDLAEALAIQEKVAAVCGGIGGWKVGQSSLEDPPSAAPLHLPLIHPAAGPLSIAGLHQPVLEIEFAFRLTRDLAPEAAITLEALVGAIEIVPLIEIVASRFRDRPGLSPLMALADQASNGLVVIGAAVAAVSLPLDQTPVSLAVDGETVQRARGHTLGPGYPWPLLLWLAQHASTRGLPLKSGDIITTGALAGITPARAGTRIEGRWGDWGRVAVDLV